MSFGELTPGYAGEVVRPGTLPDKPGDWWLYCTQDIPNENAGLSKWDFVVVPRNKSGKLVPATIVVEAYILEYVRPYDLLPPFSERVIAQGSTVVRFVKGKQTTPSPPPPSGKGNQFRFSLALRAKPALGGETLFPSYAGSQGSGSGYVEKAANDPLEGAEAGGKITVVQQYDLLPDERLVLEVQDSEANRIYRGAHDRFSLLLRVKVVESNFTGCAPGKRGSVLLVDGTPARKVDGFTLHLCGDNLIYRSGKGSAVKVAIRRG